MEGKQILKSIRLRNVLSFGDHWQSLDFEPLNVLIGANGSGKSNLLEIFSLLHALPGDLAEHFRKSGGIAEWLWKGRPDPRFFEIETTWDYAPGAAPLLHRIALAAQSFRPVVVEELIDQGKPGESGYKRHYFYSSTQFDSGKFGGPEYFDHVAQVKVAGALTGFRTDASILAQRWDSTQCPGLVFLADRYAAIQLYRRWTFGPSAPIRAPQRADLPGDYLLEDSTNLGLILNNLDRDARAQFLSSIKDLYDGAREIRVKIVGGYVELHVVEEEEERLIPGSRLSDGTLRYLSLLALLCHPAPPPLLCIEEPELGLHPDLIPKIAKLLIEAAQRTQLMVTTHSVELITALWEFPETVVVCQRNLDGSHLRRLDPERLQKWLEDYSLGELWTMGEIGGNRW